MTTYLQPGTNVNPPALERTRIGDLLELTLLDVFLILFLRDFLEDENVFAMLLKTDGVRLDIAQNPIEIFLIHAKEVAVVLFQDDGGRPEI